MNALLVILPYCCATCITRISFSPLTHTLFKFHKDKWIFVVMIASKALRKVAVSPLLTHWRYNSLAWNHRRYIIQKKTRFNVFRFTGHPPLCYKMLTTTEYQTPHYWPSVGENHWSLLDYPFTLSIMQEACACHGVERDILRISPCHRVMNYTA